MYDSDIYFVLVNRGSLIAGVLNDFFTPPVHVVT